MEKAEVIISDKFLKQLQEMRIQSHMIAPCTKAYPGDVRKLSDELHVLEDSSGKDVCGLLDGKTFYSALMETDVAHLFANSKTQIN